MSFIHTAKRAGTLPGLSVILSFIAGTGCAPKYYDSIKWQAAEVQANGDPSEWSIPLRHYDPISRLNYDFSNDQKNLYVIFRVSDQGAQMRLTQAGMEIALDTAGGKKFPVTLNYPLPSAAAPEAIPETGGSRDDTGSRKQMRKSVIATQDHVLLGGFKNVPNGLAPVTNEYGIKVGLNWDKDGTLYYEAVIPFKTFYKETLSAKDTLKPFSFRVTLDIIPGMENSDLADDGSNSGGHHRGGGGGMGGMGGGMGGTGGGGMNGGMTGTMPPPGAGAKAKGPEKSVIEFKMKLALK